MLKLEDIEKAIAQIKTISKKSGGWVIEKKIEKDKEVILEFSVTFKIDMKT